MCATQLDLLHLIRPTSLGVKLWLDSHWLAPKVGSRRPGVISDVLSFHSHRVHHHLREGMHLGRSPRRMCLKTMKPKTIKIIPSV